MAKVFKLTKAEEIERTDHIASLELAGNKLKEAVQAYNTALGGHVAAITQAQDAYNQVLEDARSWAGDIASNADEAIDERSERWQIGDKGQAAINWKDTWEALSSELADSDINMPDELDAPDLADGDTLNNAPSHADDT